MSQLVKITIITASYQAVSTIEQTLASVVSQDYPNLEYIVVDGGSTDGTVDIIKKYAPRGVRWVSESDRGLYDALNKGVRLATGDYIEIIGADDALVDSNVISRIVAQLEPDTDILSGQEWCVDEESRTQYPYYNKIVRNRKAYHGGMVPHAAMFVRRKLLLDHPFDMHYQIAADYKFFLQCYYDPFVKIQYIDEMVAFFALSGMSTNIEACQDEDNRIYDELGLAFRSPIDSNASSAKRKLKQVLEALGVFPLVAAVWRPIHRFLGIHIRWQKHHCTNPICRWCGRS